ncbi:hypothetical protein GOBAR_AA24414 [Gossypium barbadense]|uniref:Uncharacterized protein n=1 Tax=Gossypium barbadense TaxID=3634 RepID=A0A2P5WYV7_GOSBA|nr:hypothetical protein GOBAR_AA24414 [Gossypium barbadense]
MALKNQKDHWAFLEEIEAPMWVDLISETNFSSQDIDDKWFQTSHANSQTHRSKLSLLHKVNEQKPLADARKASEKVGVGNKVRDTGKENNAGEIPLSKKCNGKGKAAEGIVARKKGATQSTSAMGGKTGMVVPKQLAHDWLLCHCYLIHQGWRLMLIGVIGWNQETVDLPLASLVWDHLHILAMKLRGQLFLG